MIGAPITGSEVGLVSWWRMQDGTGNVASDTKSHRDATLHGPFPGCTPRTVAARICRLRRRGAGGDDGIGPVLPDRGRPAVHAGRAGQRHPGRVLPGAAGGAAHLAGTANRAADPGQPVRPAHRRASPTWSRTTRSTPGPMVEDHGLRGNDLLVSGGGWVLSTAPIGEDTPMARNAVLGLRTRFNGLDRQPRRSGRVRRCWRPTPVAPASVCSSGPTPSSTRPGAGVWSPASRSAT